MRPVESIYPTSFHAADASVSGFGAFVPVAVVATVAAAARAATARAATAADT